MDKQVTESLIGAIANVAGDASRKAMGATSNHTASPSADLGSLMSQAIGSLSTPQKKSSLTRSSPSESMKGLGFLGEHFSNAFAVAGLKGDEGQTVDLFGRDTDNENLKYQQFVGLKTASEAISTIGHGMQVREQEKDAMEAMAQKMQIEMEHLQASSRIRSNARQMAHIRSLTRSLGAMERQGPTGGVQRQQFIVNPVTGMLV